MPNPTPAASVQGVSLRCTRLDADGNLMSGPYDSFTTSAFIRVSFTPEYEDGEEITEKSADGSQCVSFKADDTLKRMNFEVAICNPDPELTSLLSGGLLLSGPDGNSNEVSKGWAAPMVGESPAGNGVAIEVWSRAILNGKPVPGTPYFHWVFPEAKMRQSGDRVIENGLMATTFEGTGTGNINFRNGPDGTWLWPAAADRPYMYAYSSWAPQGLNGFYTWENGSTPSPDTFVTAPGVNTPKSNDPYPYRDDLASDQILSTRDFLPDDTGTLLYPASADDGTVRNIPPTDDSLIQNPVTYKQRVTPVSVDEGAALPANAMITASDAINAAKLYDLGYVPASLDAWAAGESFTVGPTFKFYWDGNSWEPGEAPAPAPFGSDLDF